MKTTEEQMAAILNGFELWWHERGSGITPLAGHDMEEHAKRVSESAWIGGATAAIKSVNDEL